MALTPKQAKFAHKYAECGNASEAYRFAYDVAKDGATSTVWNEASTLLANPEVSSRIEKILDQAARRAEVTVDRVVAEYAKIAFHDIRRAFDENGDLKPVVDLDDDTAAAIAGVEFEEVFEMNRGKRNKTGVIHKIRLSDKRAALDSLAKFLKMFVDPETERAISQQINLTQIRQQLIVTLNGAPEAERYALALKLLQAAQEAK